MLTEKLELLKEFSHPVVVHRSDEEINSRRKGFAEIVASCALEGAEPDEFGKVVVMENIRGELSDDVVDDILFERIPEETERVIKKIELMHQLGLTWKDL